MGWKVEEEKEAGEPIGRASLSGTAATHRILLSIIPRTQRAGSTDKKSQTDVYYQGLRAGITEWTDVGESSFQSPARTYPVLYGTRLVKGALPPLDTQQDDLVLLYFPDDFPQGGYFYVFFWTDIHAIGDRPVELTELRSIVDSFAIRSSPTTASKGCAAS